MGNASNDATNAGELDDGQLDAVVGGVVTSRISTNVTVARATPRVDFDDRMRAGLDTAASPVANGAAVGGMIPGGAIISAAVSSVGALTNGSGGTSDVVTASYG